MIDGQLMGFEPQKVGTVAGFALAKELIRGLNRCPNLLGSTFALERICTRVHLIAISEIT